MPVRQRVLVTRAAQQSSALAEHLSRLGLDPVLLPAVAIAEPSSLAALDEALAHLDRYHWLLFTSANAVEVAGKRWLHGGTAAWQGGSAAPTPRSLPSTLRLAAIGPATARALNKLGWAADLVPAQAVAESLTAALLPQARQPDGMPTRFLLLRAEEARDLLPVTLRNAGAAVTIAPAYRTILPATSVDLVRNLVAGKAEALDAITFTSSSTARNLVALFEAAGARMPDTALRVSIGPITSQMLRELGLPPHAEAAEATVASLAQTVLAALEQRRRSQDEQTWSS